LSVWVSRVEAKWDPRFRGTHTLNSAPGISVVDVLVRRARWWPSG
jgi:hypothetical protein